MKKFLRRFLFLLLVFVLGVAGTALLLNSETTDDRSDMNDPVLPEVMIRFGNTLANRMYGYKDQMQVDFTRDSVTPLDTSKSLQLVVDPYDTKVQSLSYEIRTSDGQKVMENRKIKNLGTWESYLTATAQIESDLRMNQEYSMRISLDTEKGVFYYYTRIITRAQVHAEDYAHFVKSFYEKCMDKTTADDLSSYLEPENNGEATNFATINIHSTLSEISWGSLRPVLIKKGIPVIKDINETTASMTVSYQISARNDAGVTNVYDVSEFYRMRFTDTRIMLLEFQRSTNQIFNPDSSVITDEGLLLGIRSRDISYMMNEDISVIAFVQEGDLWTYSPDDGKIVRIFSFRRDDNGDFRDIRMEHEIKIIRVEGDGDVDFVLSGYMNRGNHEGRCGICVYHYSSDQNVVEEKVFIPCTEAHEFLKSDLGNLSYVNNDNQLFLLFAQKLYQVNIDEGSFRVLEEDIQPGYFVVSESNAHAAWLIRKGENYGKIKEIEFDTRQTRFVTAVEGEQIRPMGYMNEDLIYGRVKNEDFLTDENGHVSFGIHTFCIENFQGELKKEYQKDGLYVTSSTILGTMMEFELSEKQENRYAVKKTDNIMNNKKAAANQVSVEQTSTSKTGIQLRLGLQDPPTARIPLVVYAKQKSSQDRVIALDNRMVLDNSYYVYAKGGLDMITTDPAKAVKRADYMLGVVLNRNQQYVWERGNKKAQIQLNLEDIPDAFLRGIWNPDELGELLGEDGTVIDLSGCTLDSVLYEVSAKRPVVVKTGADTCVTIIGYDEYNTWLYDPASGETKPYGMNDSKNLFEKQGNIFLSYIEAKSY